MFVSYLVLVLVGITWTTTDGDLIFTQKPVAKLYLQEGSNAVLTWDYKVDNRTAELMGIIWTVYNKTQGTALNMVVEHKNGKIQYTNDALSAYGTERLKKEGRATLVIKDITFEDSTEYRCILRQETGAPVESSVLLFVTGRASFTPVVVPVTEDGGSATLTLSATGVPSQNFTWIRGGKSIVSNSKYEITSVTGSSQLTIKNISISDHGYYKCDATVNVNQPSSPRGYLGILSLKEDTDMCPKGDQYATMNKTTTICCPVRGFPPPEVTWKLPDGTVKMGNTMLPITPEKDDDFGNYTCSAVNVDTGKGPFVISLKQDDRFLPGRIGKIDVKRLAVLKPGDKLSWSPVKGALSYIVRIRDNDKYIDNDSFIGGPRKLSQEIPYHILHFKKPDKKPDTVKVIFDVLAMSESGIIAIDEGDRFPIEIHNAAATLEVSFISVIMLFIMVIILH